MTTSTFGRPTTPPFNLQYGEPPSLASHLPRHQGSTPRNVGEALPNASHIQVSPEDVLSQSGHSLHTSNVFALNHQLTVPGLEFPNLGNGPPPGWGQASRASDGHQAISVMYHRAGVKENSGVVKVGEVKFDTWLILATVFVVANASVIIQNANTPKLSPLGSAELLQVVSLVPNITQPQIFAIPKPPLSGTHNSTSNLIFCSSLCVALVALFLAMLGKQWSSYCPSEEAIRQPLPQAHHLRRRLEVSLQLFVNSLPFLIQIAALVFLSGLAYCLWRFDRPVAICITTFTAMIFIGWGWFTFKAVLNLRQSDTTDPSIALGRLGLANDSEQISGLGTTHLQIVEEALASRKHDIEKLHMLAGCFESLPLGHPDIKALTRLMKKFSLEPPIGATTNVGINPLQSDSPSTSMLRITQVLPRNAFAEQSTSHCGKGYSEPVDRYTSSGAAKVDGGANDVLGVGREHAHYGQCKPALQTEELQADLPTLLSISGTTPVELLQIETASRSTPVAVLGRWKGSEARPGLDSSTSLPGVLGRGTPGHPQAEASPSRHRFQYPTVIYMAPNGPTTPLEQPPESVLYLPSLSMSEHASSEMTSVEGPVQRPLPTVIRVRSPHPSCNEDAHDPCSQRRDQVLQSPSPLEGSATSASMIE